MAQDHSHSAEQECGATLTLHQQERLDQTAVARERFQSNGRRGTLYIPVRHIIVRRTNGTGGLSSIDLQTAMDELNADYSPAAVQFYECTRIFVNDDNYYNLFWDDRSALASSNSVSNVVNIYHVEGLYDIRVDSVGDSTTVSYCGVAPYPGGSDNIFMKNSCTRNGTTLAHELGHYFSLNHTFHNNNELVDGSNCTTAGDRICDTNADPRASGSEVANCVYIGNETDPNGDTYNPPISNHMSYYSKPCRTLFTSGQLARIRYSAINDRSYLSCSCSNYNYVGRFNFGATTSGNNYTTSSNVNTTTAYNCDGDNLQLRVGDCSSSPNTGGDFVSVEFDVPVGTERLSLRLRGGWQNGAAEIYADNIYQRNFSFFSTTCNYNSVYLYNLSNLTQDGKIVLKFVDPDPGCSGDFNIDDLLVYAANCTETGYAKLPYSTSFTTGLLDNYWITQSSNEFGRARLTTTNGPYSGGFHLVMDSRVNGRYATNQADLRVDLATCANVNLYFRWKEFNDETHSEDGVYFSNNGGETFVKIYSLTDGTNNIWNSVNLDLDFLAGVHNLSFTEECIIRFQQYDNYSATTDGIAIDRIRVLGCNNTPLPLIALATEDHARGQVRSYYPGSETSQDDPQLNTFNAVDQSLSLEVFPNPAQDILNVQLTAFEKNEEVTIKLVNLLGQIQYSSQHTVNNSANDLIRLQVQQLPAGMYTIVVENQQRVVAHKQVVLQR